MSAQPFKAMAAPEPLPALVRRLREQRGWTQQQLADQSGFTVQVVSTTEQGRNIPSRLAALGMVKGLGRAKPLYEREIHDLLSACQIVPLAADNTLPEREREDYQRENLMIPPQQRTIAEMVKGRPVTLAHPVADLTGQLQILMGAQSLTELLFAMLKAIKPSATYVPEAAPITPMIKHPPRETPDGFTVQVIEPNPPPPPAPSSSTAAPARPPHRRKAQ